MFYCCHCPPFPRSTCGFAAHAITCPISTAGFPDDGSRGGGGSQSGDADTCGAEIGTNRFGSKPCDLKICLATSSSLIRPRPSI